MKVQCKCHGLSGSCQLRTCWKSAPEFHIVGNELMRLFRKAILVDQSNLASSQLIINSNQPGHRKAKRNHLHQSHKSFIKHKLKMNMLERSLFYYQRSPNFCEPDSSADIPGTHILFSVPFFFIFVFFLDGDAYCALIFLL